MTPELLDKFKHRLTARQQTLAQEVREGNQLRTDSETYEDHAGEVADTGDNSVAIELMDVRNAEISRDVGELSGIERAFARMSDGDYGICTTCGIDIPLARLEAEPTAERCIACQTLYEHQHATPTGSKI